MYRWWLDKSLVAGKIQLTRCELMSRSCQALVLATTMLLVGCGGAPRASLPTTPATEEGLLSSSSPTIDFGSVTLGSSTTQNGTLTASTSTVTITSVSWNGAGFSLSGIVFPVILSAGQSVPFTVTFAPEAPARSPGAFPLSAMPRILRRGKHSKATGLKRKFAA